MSDYLAYTSGVVRLFATLDDANAWLAEVGGGKMFVAVERLAAAEAARGIAEQQLTVICDGVNRRCNADNRQLPLVSLDRMLAAHKRDLTECRRLLREACDECHVVDGVLVKGALTHRHSHNGARLPEEWFTEAAKAAGGGE